MSTHVYDQGTLGDTYKEVVRPHVSGEDIRFFVFSLSISTIKVHIPLPRCFPD